MSTAARIGLGAGIALVPAGLTGTWVDGAENRLEHYETAEAEDPQGSDIAVAAAANEEYCDGDLRRVLRRVLQSCGLLSTGEVRGCQPVQAKSVATMAGSDFNALFLPLAERAAIVQFDKDSADLDNGDRSLLNKVFADQRGASYFFVVSRSSPEGSVQHNRALSQQRAEAVMGHLRDQFNDPDLEKEVGLLWLGEEYAQLDESFCSWQRSGAKCQPRDLNRSAFVAWIDCRL